MNGNTNSFPIKREQFEGEEDALASKKAGWIKSEIGREMEKIRYGGPSEVANLWDIVRKIDTQDDFLYSPDESVLLQAVRDAFCVHKYMYQKVIGPRVGAVGNGQMSESEKKERMKYANLHSTFIASGFALSKLEELAKKASTTKPTPPNLNNFQFALFELESQMRSYSLGKLATTLKAGKESNVVADTADVVNVTVAYLKQVNDTLLKEKEKFRMMKLPDGSASMVDDLENTVFDIDGVHFKGWEYEGQKQAAPKLEFKEVKPTEVVGNTLAKKHMLRDVERLSLYNFEEKKNPILEFGALNWATLLDGLPGTGKTTMMQMEMTYLKDICEKTGVPFRFWIIDAAEKNQYYGQTQQQYRAKLDQTVDPTLLNLVYFDDVDLIIPGRQDASMNSADQDVLKLFMDYLAGVYTVFRGNTISRAATNAATNLDDAFRQRFKGRYHIDGPTTEEDCAKLMMIKFAKSIKHGLVDIEPGKGINPDEVAKEYEHVISPETQQILSSMKIKPSSVSWRDIGRLAHAYQKIDPRFTGRFMDNVASNVFVTSADFDLDKKIFEDRSLFFDKTYAEQVNHLKGYFKAIKPETIVNELDRYFQSEIRYMRSDKEKKLEHAVESMLTQHKAQQIVVKQIGAE